MNYKKLAFFLLFVVTLIWGFAAIVIKFTLGGISPLPFLTYRFLISFLAAILILAFTKNKYSYSIKTWFGIFVYSVLSTTFALGFLFVGLEKTTVLELSLIALIGPLVTSYAGVLFLKEHITKREKIGTLIAFLGTIFTIIEPIINSQDIFSSVSGNILLFTYLVGDVASIILLKKLVREKIPPLFLTNISFIIGFIVLLPISFIFLGVEKFISTLANLEFIYHFGVIYMALVSGTIAYALRAKAQKTLEVGQTAIFGYLTPILSMPLAVFFLGEKVTPMFLLGGIIVATGIFIAETKAKKQKTNR